MDKQVLSFNELLKIANERRSEHDHKFSGAYATEVGLKQQILYNENSFVTEKFDLKDDEYMVLVLNYNPVKNTAHLERFFVRVSNEEKTAWMNEDVK
jgi:hypothetical protein